jgi:hypothetical protein
MKNLLIYSVLAFTSLAAVSPEAFARTENPRCDRGDRDDWRDRYRDRDRDRDRDRYRDRDDDRYRGGDRYRYRDNDRRVYRDYRGINRRDRSRTIYVIERNRPVRRVVYLAPDGRYYRIRGGRRVFVQERYYTTYPSRYFYRDGRPRVNIRIGL